MRSFTDLTHEELIALDETAITRYIDQGCAEDGISLLPVSAPKAPQFDAIEPEIEHFVVAGLRFCDESEAVTVRDTLRACKSRRQTAKYGWVWTNPDYDQPDTDAPEITRVRVLSAQQAAEKGEEIERRRKATESYEKDKQAYDLLINARRRIVDSIRGSVERASQLEYRRERLRADFGRYSELADGDERIARRFLLKAHADAEQTAPDLFPSGWNIEEACAKERP